MNNISIIGAGGHTKSSINLLNHTFKNCKFSIYDDSYNENISEYIHNIKLVGKVNVIDDNSLIFLSIGDNGRRKKFFLEFKNQIVKENALHKNSIVEKNVIMGDSNQIFANTVINSYVTIADNNIINTSSVLEHEVSIGSHNHISVGTKICGRAKIADNCFIGSNAVVIDRISICSGVIVGAGSVVINDIVEPVTYVGNPARKIK